MATLDDAFSAVKRGVAGLRGQTMPPTAGGAVPPQPLPEIDPSMASAPAAPPVAPDAGLRGNASQFQGPPNPNANPNVGNGAASAEAQAFRASGAGVAAAPAVAPVVASEAAPTLASRASALASKPISLTRGLGVASGALSAYDAVQNGGVGVGDAGGLAAGIHSLPLPAPVKLVADAGVAGLTAGKSIYDNLLPDGLKNTIGGTLAQAASNFGLSGGEDAVDAEMRGRIAPVVGPIQAPIVPGAPVATAAPSPSIGPLSLSSPAPSSKIVSPGDQTSVPGIVRNGNSFTNIGTNPDGSNGATTTPDGLRSGFDLAGANAIQARANAINASATNISDPNGGFQNPNGVATASGTPLSAEPRMQVSGGSNGIGGLIVDKQAARQRALDIQQQQVLGGQAIQRDDLGLRRQQLGFDNQFRAATLGHTIDHDNATVGIAGAQLKREGLRDAFTAQHQVNEEGIARDRNTAELGLRRDQLTREQGNDAFTQGQAAQNDYGKQVAGTISNALRDDKGNVDPNLVAEHVSNANGLVANRIAQLRSELAANPGNKTAAQVLSTYQQKGIAALSPTDRQNVQAATEFGQLARKTGTGDLNPFGGTNVEMRTPIDSIQKETSLSGSVYRGYQNGKPTKMTVPSRYIEGDGSFVGGTRNSRFANLMPTAQQ